MPSPAPPPRRTAAPDRGRRCRSSAAGRAVGSALVATLVRRHGTRVRPVRGLASGVRASSSVSPMHGNEDDHHRDRADQRPGQVAVEVPPPQPAQDRDEEELGQVDPVGVVRTGLHHGAGPPGSASMDQGDTDQVDAGDGADVERDHDRLERIGARAQPRRDVIGRQVVPGLGRDRRSQRARDDERHVRAEPFVELVEMHRDHHAGDEIELVRGDLARGPVTLHPRRHQAPMHGRHQHDLYQSAGEQHEAMVAGRPPEEDQEQREQRVELQEDEQVVELVVAGAEQVQQMDHVGSGRPVITREADAEVDDRPAQVRHRDQGEAPPPERAVVDARKVPDAVGEHAGRDEEERLPGDVQQLERAPTAKPAATGAKTSRVCVDTTPACFTGRMASM